MSLNLSCLPLPRRPVTFPSSCVQLFKHFTTFTSLCKLFWLTGQTVIESIFEQVLEPLLRLAGILLRSSFLWAVDGENQWLRNWPRVIYLEQNQFAGAFLDLCCAVDRIASADPIRHNCTWDRVRWQRWLNASLAKIDRQRVLSTMEIYLPRDRVRNNAQLHFMRLSCSSWKRLEMLLRTRTIEPF